MQCPKCNEPLALAKRHGVEIDYCPKCRGVWLDRGELDKIIDRVAEHFAVEEEFHFMDQEQQKPGRFPVYPAPEDHRRRFFFETFFDFE